MSDIPDDQDKLTSADQDQYLEMALAVRADLYRVSQKITQMNLVNMQLFVHLTQSCYVLEMMARSYDANVERIEQPWE
jgi:hypothetical protein